VRLDRPLETPRLTLRSLSSSDVTSRYVGWLNDSEVNRYLETRHTVQSKETVRAFVESMNASIDNLLLGLFVKVDSRHIGNVRLGPIINHHRHAAIGLVIGEKSEWHKGLAAEAIDAVAGHALRVLDLRKVIAGFYAGNTISMKAFRRAGFVEEARLRDHWWHEDAWQDGVLMARFAHVAVSS
jgi:RimJ/RimL family protein N-acetyltransferase